MNPVKTFVYGDFSFLGKDWFLGFLRKGSGKVFDHSATLRKGQPRAKSYK